MCMMKKVIFYSFSNVFDCFQPCERMHSMPLLIEIHNNGGVGRRERDGGCVWSVVDRFEGLFRGMSRTHKHVWGTLAAKCF